MKRRLSIVGVLTLGMLTVSCGSMISVAPSTSSIDNTARWVDQPVSFVAGGLTIYATYRHQVNSKSVFPGVLLIAGSGPTDRNGNTVAAPGAIDTLETLAQWFSSDGVASLRYDKLGSGQTGLGSYGSNPNAIGIKPFQEESLAALEFLARQKGINEKRLGVFGHSEGALFALMLAAKKDGHSPPIHALGLLEPLSIRYLDVVATQVDVQVNNEVKLGYYSKAEASKVDSSLSSAIDQLRKTGQVSTVLPYGLASILNPSTERFLYQADLYDPAVLASELNKKMPVMVSCSTSDIQVTCAQVRHLIGGLSQASAQIDLVQLDGVDHVLKVDPSGASSGYTKPLPFSPQLKSAVAGFAQQYLR